MAEVPAPRHARDIPLARRVLAYLLMLGGYFLYCYNFNTVDYVRPYLMSVYHFGFGINAQLSVVTNVFVTIGALCGAPLLARLGRRRSLSLIAFGIGAFAAILALQRTALGWLASRALLSAFLGAYYVSGINLTVALFPAGLRAKLAAVSSGTYSLSEIVIGLLGAQLGDGHWTVLLWLGALPLVIAPLMLWLIPRDDSFVPYGAEHVEAGPSGGWREMASRRWRWLALGCAVLAGLNYTGYQLFSSYVTVFLKHDRGFSAGDMGAIVATIGTGSLLGGFIWAFVADRFGRRAPSIGFLAVAGLIGVFLVAPRNLLLLQIVGFFYGVGLSSTYSWGIWFTEIFPARLRPYGAALLHAGHVVSLIAPVITAQVAGRWGLTAAMTFAPVAFLGAFAIWLALPETLRTGLGYKGWNPDHDLAPA